MAPNGRWVSFVLLCLVGSHRDAMKKKFDIRLKIILEGVVSNVICMLYDVYGPMIYTTM